jgi:hypothetical protein
VYYSFFLCNLSSPLNISLLDVLSLTTCPPSFEGITSRRSAMVPSSACSHRTDFLLTNLLFAPVILPDPSSKPFSSPYKAPSPRPFVMQADPRDVIQCPNTEPDLPLQDERNKVPASSRRDDVSFEDTSDWLFSLFLHRWSFGRWLLRLAMVDGIKRGFPSSSSSRSSCTFPFSHILPEIVDSSSACRPIFSGKVTREDSSYIS